MDAGPRNARRMLSRYLASSADAGARLPIADVDRAAEQFLTLCQGYLIHDLILGAARAPSQREIEGQVDVALTASLPSTQHDLTDAPFRLSRSVRCVLDLFHRTHDVLEGRGLSEGHGRHVRVVTGKGIGHLGSRDQCK